MPRGHGRTVFVHDNAVEKRSNVLSRRTSEHDSSKLSSNESLVLVPVLRNCEERFLTHDVRLSRVMESLNSFIQGPELQNKQSSPNPVNANMLNTHNSSYPHPIIFIQFDLQKEQFATQENPAFAPGSVQTFKDYLCSASNVLGDPLKLKRDKFKNNINHNSLPNAAAKESSWLTYGSNCIPPNASADAASKVDQPAKKSPKKKGKKKRKQYKRSVNNKSSVKPEDQGEDVNGDASKSETFIGGELVCSTSSENNSLLVVPCLSSLDQDDSSEGSDQPECNSEERLSISSSFMRKQLDKDINGSGKPVSLPHEFTDDDADKISLEATSSSDQLCELSLSTSLRNNPEIDMTEDSLDDFGTDWSIANDVGFNSLEKRMNFASTNVPVNGDCKEYSHGDNGLSSSSYGHCSDSQKDVADTDYCGSERALCSNHASSSDDFCPVIRMKRGRLARKLSGCSNESHRFNNAHLHRFSETNKHSSWKKVEKASYPELTRPRNNKSFASRNVDVSLNCIETKARPLNEPKQRRGKLVRYSNGVDLPQSYSSIVSSNVETDSGHISMDGSSHLEKSQRKQNLASERLTCANNINIPSKIRVPGDENFDTTAEFSDISQLTDRDDTSSRATESSQNTILQKPTGIDDICSILQNTSSMSQETNSDQSHTDAQFHSSIQPLSSYMDCSSPEDGELINKLDSSHSSSSEESSDFTAPSDFLFSPETKGQPFRGFETDLSKIIEAVNGSYKLSVSAEGDQLAMGSSLAGFERVLHSASPHVETGCIGLCNTCSQSQIKGDSLCSHQVPNFSLRTLWKWYEKPGSYGLEVKLDEFYASKRLQAGISKFCAYFVPYLSAVQLFGRSGKSIHDQKNKGEVDLMKPREVCDAPKGSIGLGSLPIFSKLLPQPWKKGGLTKISSSDKSEELDKAIFSEQSADELLFEYFDSDQPQQRKPLFDKIQELIHGDSSSNGYFFGDPSKLWCLNLNELHPASWYAVAWYPIYRIPDGSFRASFLTYHSFGRFARINTSKSTDGCIDSLILPVVGLQSYNAQGEFWFEPMNSNSRTVRTDASTLNSPSENLKGRLQSLERAAYVMSRANIIKGNLNCTNRHPDFEFFLSRKR